MVEGVEEPRVIAAHTHLPVAPRSGGWTIFNPGGVGVPPLPRKGMLPGMARGGKRPHRGNRRRRGCEPSA